MTRPAANSIWPRAKDACRRLWREETGLAAVEFAMVLPSMIILYVGGLEFTQATSVARRMADMNVILADIVSQNPKVVQPGDIDGENTAVTQVMAPLDVTPLTVVTMEITTDPTFTGSTAGHGTVNWSRSLQGGANAPCIKYPANTGCSTGAQTPYPANTAVTTLPASLAANTTYLVVQTYYNYQVTVGAKIINSIPILSDQVFSLPRGTSSISCPTCS